MEITEIQIKQFLIRYWLPLVTALVILVSIALSWQFWQQYRLRQFDRAAGYYEQLLNTILHHPETKTIQPQVDQLIQQFTQTPYAQLAALFAAREAVYQNDWPRAEKNLLWASQHGQDNLIKTIASIRAARILIMTKQPRRALELLSTLHDPTFKPVILETQGDIQASLNDWPEAIRSYEKAKQSSPENTSLLNLKLEHARTHIKQST